VFFREKTLTPSPGGTFGLAFFSAWKRRWIAIVSSHQSQDHQNHPSLMQDFRKQDCSPDLHALLETLRKIRHRILTNLFFMGWTEWATWILIGLIAGFAIIAKLAIALILAVTMVAAGAGVIALWTWRTRLSMYETACRLDSAAKLQDRVSTAIYFGDTISTGDMIDRQRGDALTKISKLDMRGLFPLRKPLAARRAAVLFLAVGALYFYRIHHQPPLAAFLQTVARSPLVQSILSPLLNAVEKDLQRTIALVTSKPDALADGVRPGETASSGDDLWQSSNDKNAGENNDQKDSLDAGAGDTPQDQMQPPGEENSSQPADSRQQENANSESQDGKKSGDNSSGDSQKPSDSQDSQNPRESLAQSLMQAMKNMISNSPNQQSKNRDRQQSQQQDSEGSPQSGNSHQPGSKDSEKKSDSRGTSDAEQKPNESASNGAGSQQGSKEMKKDQQPTGPVHAVPDRVALESNGFKEQTRMRMETETGTAQVGDRGLRAQGGTIINGAEQENIPARYRLYVQRYFEHADSDNR
jgi:hypothetical protein